MTYTLPHFTISMILKSRSSSPAFFYVCHLPIDQKGIRVFTIQRKSHLVTLDKEEKG